jgi:hypothetical protein
MGETRESEATLHKAAFGYNRQVGDAGGGRYANCYDFVSMLILSFCGRVIGMKQGANTFELLGFRLEAKLVLLVKRNSFVVFHSFC